MGTPRTHAGTLTEILNGAKYFVKITVCWDTRDNSKREYYRLLKEYNPFVHKQLKKDAHKQYEVERGFKLDKIEVYSIECKLKEEIKIK